MRKISLLSNTILLRQLVIIPSRQFIRAFTVARIMRCAAIVGYAIDMRISFIEIDYYVAAHSRRD